MTQPDGGDLAVAIAGVGDRLDQFAGTLDPRERAALAALVAAAARPSAPRHVNLVVKATRLCNLRCTYCHDWRVGPGSTMSGEVLEHLLARTLGDPSHDVVDLTWHGGEPTVLGIGWYERALAITAAHRRPGQVVRHTIQTNGTGIDDGWAAFLARHRFRVGVSIDGPRAVHDAQRVDRRGRPTFDAVLAGVEALRRHGIEPGFIAVVDRRALELGPAAFLDGLVEAGIRNLRVLPAQPGPVPGAEPGAPVDHYVRRSETVAFLIGLADALHDRGLPRVEVAELTDIGRRLRGHGRVSCTLAGSCAGSLFSIEPDGDVNHCDEFVGDDAYVVGNIVRQDWRAIRAGLRLKAIAHDDARAAAGMRGCPEFAVCNGWCPHERYLAARHDPAGVDPGCCGLRPLIEHVRRSLEHEPVAVRVRAVRT